MNLIMGLAVGWLSPSEPVGEVVEGGREVITSPQAEFASDEAFDTSQLTSDSVKQELQELGMTGDSKKLTSCELPHHICVYFRGADIRFVSYTVPDHVNNITLDLH